MERIIQLTWANGTASASPDPVMADTGDLLSFQSSGPTTVVFHSDPAHPDTPATFSVMSHTIGDPPVLVVRAGHARYDCTLYDSAGNIQTTSGKNGNGGGVRPGTGGGVGH